MQAAARELDLDYIRGQFPSLNPGNGLPPVFFDNPGGTQVPAAVIDAVSDCYRNSNANLGGYFETSRRAGDIIDQTRARMAAFLNAPDPDTIVFGNNMTSLTFHVARSIADTILPGDEIVVTDLDHDANVAPWLDLQAQGAVIRCARMDPADCTLSAATVRAEISERTRLVAVTAASNAVGTIPDIRAIVQAAHEVGALAYIDAVQYAPHRLIDVQALDCDFLACSSYKFFGPHAGILFGKRSVLEGIKPHKVRPCPNALPHCWETGTQNHEGIAGIGAAVEYLAGVTAPLDIGSDDDIRPMLERSMQAIAEYESTLCARLIDGLLEIPGVRIFGITDPLRKHERLCTVAFTWDRFSPSEIARRLGADRICCWSGNYYAFSLMDRLGLEGKGGAVRIGPAHYNTLEEVERLLEILNGMAA